LIGVLDEDMLNEGVLNEGVLDEGVLDEGVPSFVEETQILSRPLPVGFSVSGFHR